MNVKPTIKATIDYDEIYVPPCNIELSADPFHDSEIITLEVRGKHPTQGLLLEQSPDWNNRVMITGCYPGTSG